jgi:hypothetical protein
MTTRPRNWLPEPLSKIAETMSDPADPINRAVETLQAASIDLPAFSTLDRLINRLLAEVHVRIYNRVFANDGGHAAALENLWGANTDPESIRMAWH